MNGYIKGTVSYVNDGTVIIDNHGVGYEIFCSTSALSRLSGASGEVTVYTYLKVSEDDISLFGFLDKAEKGMFLKLIGVPGVGPKTALGITGSIKAEDFYVAVEMGDYSALARVKGLGKKTAEKIVLELRGKLPPMNLFTTNSAGGGSSGDTISIEAMQALVQLGLNEAEALKRVKQFRPKSESTQELIGLCLRNKG